MTCRSETCTAAELIAHHDKRCGLLEGAPRSVVGLVPHVFQRDFGPREIGFAFGKAFSHVNYLLRTNRLEANAEDGPLVRFIADDAR
jgi:hypothetical protein